MMITGNELVSVATCKVGDIHKWVLSFIKILSICCTNQFYGFVSSHLFFNNSHC